MALTWLNNRLCFNRFQAFHDLCPQQAKLCVHKQTEIDSYRHAKYYAICLHDDQVLAALPVLYM